jgi:hypothetical protein
VIRVRKQDQKERDKQDCLLPKDSIQRGESGESGESRESRLIDASGPFLREQKLRYHKREGLELTNEPSRSAAQPASASIASMSSSDKPK